MRVKFLGSGDAFGSGGRLNTCILVEDRDRRLLLDLGATAMVSLRRFEVDPNTIDLILISHLHGDHFGGLPSFLLDARLVSRRSRPLTVAGPPGLPERLTAATEALFPGASERELPFPLTFVTLEPGRTTEIGGLAVAAVEVVHPSGAPSLGLRLAFEGRSIAYTGDTEWTDALIAIGRDADLLIGECYAFDGPVRYHLDHGTWMRNAPRIGARRLVLTHLSAGMLTRLTDVAFETASDGLEIEVG